MESRITDALGNWPEKTLVDFKCPEESSLLDKPINNKRDLALFAEWFETQRELADPVVENILLGACFRLMREKSKDPFAVLSSEVEWFTEDFLGEPGSRKCRVTMIYHHTGQKPQRCGIKAESPFTMSRMAIYESGEMDVPSTPS